MKNMEKNRSIFDTWVIVLIIAMIFLVVCVIGWVATDTYINRSYHAKLIEKLDGIEYITADSVIPIDSSKILTAKDIKDLLDQRIEKEASIIDSNNYLAIILTLITLCVSLSVVIPYIVGKAVSAKDIKDTVEELYMKNEFDVAVQDKKNLNLLLASEAHLSRMVSYSLLSSARFTYPSLNRPEYDVANHPVWAMGWAAKSLIRYITSCPVDNYQSHLVFVKKLVTYIRDSYEALISPEGKSFYWKGSAPAKRTLLDLLNAITYQTTLKTLLLDDKEIKDLYDIIKGIYACLEDQNFNTSSLAEMAYKKSHYDIYLHNKADLVSFRTHLEGYVKGLK